MSRALAEVVVATGYWPPSVPFAARDLVTVLEIMREDT